MASSIVFGDVDGQFDDIFAKLALLQPKHKFTFAIITGNFFAEPDTAGDASNEALQRLMNGDITVALPTYFACGRRQLPALAVQRLQSNSGELCPNLSILGPKTSLKTAEGLRLVAVTGILAEHEQLDESQYSYTADDAQSVGSNLDQCDILVTTEWPSHIRERSRASYEGAPIAGVECISDLCKRLRPKYHFSSSPAFFEREPFTQLDGEEPPRVTRFISVAPFANPTKHKAMYAFSLEPGPAPANIAPVDCTACPFPSAKKRKVNDGHAANRTRFSHNPVSDDRNFRHRGNRKRQRHVPQPQECYFCLSRDAGRHMITSIGDMLYMTIAKGPLTTPASCPGLNLPCHMLLIPVAHLPTIRSMPEEERAPVLAEMQKYRNGLHEMLIARSKGADGRSQLGSVTWEISRASGMHLHWQFVPVPVHRVDSGLVEAAFVQEAKNLDYPAFAKTTDETETAQDGDFFRVMIWSETASKEMVLPFDQSFRFDLQFGRRVLARLLGLEDRSEWRRCAQEEAEETADVAAFREAFREFDFSLT